MMSMTARPTKSFEGSKTAHNPTWWHALLIGNNVLVHNASPKSGRAIYWYQSELNGQITLSYYAPLLTGPAIRVGAAMLSLLMLLDLRMFYKPFDRGKLRAIERHE